MGKLLETAQEHVMTIENDNGIRAIDRGIKQYDAHKEAM